jgi:Ser/Thr protein kinase RdoA (MazF antagonist)
MTSIRVERSFFAAEAVAELVAQEYDIDGTIECKLFTKMLRTQDNDHYRVKVDGEKKYVLRIYQIGRYLQREESDYQFEVEWLTYLADKGHRVARPLPRRNGELLGELDAPEGLRYYALFSYVEGAEMPLNNQDLYYELGKNMAEIHQASAGFKTTHHRQAWDLHYLMDLPLERLKRNWSAKRWGDYDVVLASADEARGDVLRLLGGKQTPDRWGVIGGDFHTVNTFATAVGELSFINFDLCGYGWFAYDIAVFLLNTDLLNQPVELSEAFFAGYFAVRPLAEEEHEAIAAFMTLRRLWLMGYFAMGGGFAGHTFIASANRDD